MSISGFHMHIHVHTYMYPLHMHVCMHITRINQSINQYINIKILPNIYVTQERDTAFVFGYRNSRTAGWIPSRLYEAAGQGGIFSSLQPGS